MKNLKFIAFLLISTTALLELSLRAIPYFHNYCAYGDKSIRDDNGRNIKVVEYAQLLKEGRVERPRDGILQYDENVEYRYPIVVPNHLGLFDSEKTDPQIIVVGDSFTQGIGAPPDSSWPALLEAACNRSVLNAGIRGSNPCFEYRLTDWLITDQSLRPDDIILCLNTSDIYDLQLFRVKNINLYIYKFFYRIFQTRRIVRFRIEDRTEQTLEEIAGYVQNIQALCKQHKIHFYVVVLPLFEELQNPDGWEWQPLIEKFKDNHINVIPLFSPFSELPDADAHFWEYDRHNNSKGYELISRTVASDICLH